MESYNLCINGKRHVHRLVKRNLSFPIDLLAWLDAQKGFPKCYWRGRDGFEVAAIGTVLAISSVPHFDPGNDSPARFWGGQAFSPHLSAKDALWSAFPKCVFFLPRVEIIRRGKEVEVFTHAIDGAIGDEPSITPHYFSSAQLNVHLSKTTPTQQKWSELIQHSLSEIEKNSFEKVVLARRSTHVSSDPIKALELLSRIQSKEAILFALQFSQDASFIGATPERLYKREGRTILTEAIAGTRKRGQTEDEDRLLEMELVTSQKERREFEFVKTSIRDSLEPICEKISSLKEDGIVKTPNVQHLHHAFSAELLDESSDEQILSALHPTAAIGGLPRKTALEHLLQHEPFDRGWYASPIGFISESQAEFAVAIRSALIKENALHLFAGAGIVAGSTAEKEWEELDHKTSLWRNLCNQVN